MSGKLQHMRKERTIRKILQTKIQQQINSEKTNRRKKQKNETKHLASQAKYSLHKKNNRRKEQTLHSNGKNKRDKERIHN